MNLQVLKDTFYASLAARVAAGNPARTIVVRGVIRPAVLVVENELPGAAVDGIAPAETFCLRWTALRVESAHAESLVKLLCEVRYATDGTPGAAGIDRGRTLAAMDAEFAEAVLTSPMNAPAMAFAETTGGGSSTALATGYNIFWGNPVFGPVVTRGERLERIAEVEVFGYVQ